MTTPSPIDPHAFASTIVETIKQFQHCLDGERDCVDIAERLREFLAEVDAIRSGLLPSDGVEPDVVLDGPHGGDEAGDGDGFLCGHRDTVDPDGGERR